MSSGPLLSSDLLISLTLPEDVPNKVTPYGLWPWATAQDDTSIQEPPTEGGPWELPAPQEGLHPPAPNLWDPHDAVSPFCGRKKKEAGP